MGESMKAMVYRRYGGPEVLELVELPRPTPGPTEVLIEVVASSLNRSDWESLTGRPMYARINGVFRPRKPILGTDVAGRVIDVGEAVTSFRPGDEVLADTMFHGGGTFAEYVSVPQSAPLIAKPPQLSFAEASTLPQSGAIAFEGIVDKVAAGHRVLINGAGGGTGAFAIQLAKAAGAHVTGVDNGSKQEFMRQVGADEVIDYRSSDYTRDGKYDLILDLVCERSMFSIRRAVAPGGSYSVAGGTVPSILSASTLGKLLSTGGRHLGVLMVRSNKEDLGEIAGMVADRSLRTFIDRSYTLEGVPEALTEVGAGRALGKLVIEFG